LKFIWGIRSDENGQDESADEEPMMMTQEINELSAQPRKSGRSGMMPSSQMVAGGDNKLRNKERSIRYIIEKVS
jgi:hypothetical protein